MSAISGPAEDWLIEMHDSFASLETVDKVLNRASPLTPKDAAPFPDLLADSQTLIASYRPTLSYRADEGMQMFPKMRYLDIAVIRIRVGTESDLARLLKLRSFSLGSVNADRPEIVYQVVSGAPAGVYLVLAPMTSLRTLDNGRADTPAYAEGADQRRGGKIVPGQNSRGSMCGCVLNRMGVTYRMSSRLRIPTSGVLRRRWPLSSFSVAVPGSSGSTGAARRSRERFHIRRSHRP